MPRLSKARKELLTTMMKEAIFEATASVLCEHGVEGTTMNRVAEAAQVSKSNLYDYFASKDDLLAFVSERILGPFLKAIEDIVPARLPAAHKLETILRTALDVSTKHRAIIRLLAQSHHDQQARKSNRPRVLEAFTAIIEQGIEDGSFHAYNPAHMGRIFLGCLAELFELQVSNASNEVTSEYVEVLINAILHGFSFHVEKSPQPGRASPRVPNL